MTLTDRIALTQPIASDITRLNDWLESAFEQSRLNRAIAADIKLCINEIFANLISYAFEETANPAIEIELKLDTGRASAVVEDNGIHFDFRDWPEPERPKNIATAKIGGFGIALIRERASDIRYVRKGALNELTIVCDRSSV
jgi:sigma-B regulation protein RsbU (phosphoserine phosphatase)